MGEIPPAPRKEEEEPGQDNGETFEEEGCTIRQTAVRISSMYFQHTG
jgi:hypothetical protein